MALQGGLTTLFLLLVLSHYHTTTSYWIPPYTPGRALLLAGALLVVWVTARAGRGVDRLRGLDASLLRTPSGRRRMLFALVWPVAGLAGGYTFGLWFSQGYGPRVGQAYGLSFVSVGLVLATEVVLARRPSAVSRPSRLMGQALAFQAVVLTFYALAFSVGFGAANLAAYPWLSWTAFGDGAVLGLWLGVAIGIGRTCDSAWTHHSSTGPTRLACSGSPASRFSSVTTPCRTGSAGTAGRLPDTELDQPCRTAAPRPTRLDGGRSPDGAKAEARIR